MNDTQKVLLKNEITIQLSKAKITVDNLKQVEKKERKEFIDIKLLEVNDALLRWALQKQVISKSELITNKFFTQNKHINEKVLNGIISTSGLGVSGFAFSSATAPVFLGFGGGISGIGVLGATTIAAPIVLSSLAIYGIIKYKEHKELEKLIEYFETEKKNILNFYINKINDLKLLDK